MSSFTDKNCDEYLTLLVMFLVIWCDFNPIDVRSKSQGTGYHSFLLLAPPIPPAADRQDTYSRLWG